MVGKVCRWFPLGAGFLGGYKAAGSSKSHARIIWDACWTEDNKYFITGSRDKTVSSTPSVPDYTHTDIFYATGKSVDSKWKRMDMCRDDQNGRSSHFRRYYFTFQSGVSLLRFLFVSIKWREDWWFYLRRLSIQSTPPSCWTREWTYSPIHAAPRERDRMDTLLRSGFLVSSHLTWTPCGANSYFTSFLLRIAHVLSVTSLAFKPTTTSNKVVLASGSEDKSVRIIEIVI